MKFGFGWAEMGGDFFSRCTEWRKFDQISVFVSARIFHYDVNRHVDEIKNIFMTKKDVEWDESEVIMNGEKRTQETQQKRDFDQRHVEEALKNYIFLLFFSLSSAHCLAWEMNPK